MTETSAETQIAVSLEMSPGKIGNNKPGTNTRLSPW